MLRRLHELPLDEFDALSAHARSEGYRFLDRLRDEWRSGTARFDGDGEALLGAFKMDRLIAIGGLHWDPYAAAPTVGRLRRMYVAPDCRRRGIAANLVARLLQYGRSQFEVVRLRVPNAEAARFYERLGFTSVAEIDATHVMRLQ